MNIVEYDQFRANVEEVKDVCNFLPDVSTDEGYQKSKRISLDVGKILTSLEKCRKEKKSHTLELGREIDKQAKSLSAELEEYQLPHKEAYKELDNALKEREAARKAKLEGRVVEIRNLPEAMQDSDSSGIKMALESLQVEECLDFYEYTEQALKARNASRETLGNMFATKLKQEQEQAELEQLRKEKAEQEQKDRDARIAQEAADKAKLEAEEKAEIERKKVEKAAEAERQRVQSERERAEAAQQAAIKEKEDAERRLVEQTERAEREQQEAVERERQRVADEKAQEEAEAKAREKNRKHKSEINNQAVACLVDGGIDQKIAKVVVTLIAKRKISNIVINY